MRKTKLGVLYYPTHLPYWKAFWEGDYAEVRSLLTEADKDDPPVRECKKLLVAFVDNDSVVRKQVLEQEYVPPDPIREELERKFNVRFDAQAVAA